VAEYRVEERSLIYGALKRNLWEPMLGWIPLSASANTLTLLGNLNGALASALLLLFPASRAAWAAAGLLYFSYLCLDNLDGAQARRTGGGTPLGEVLDHWLDCVNGVLLFAATAHMLGLTGLHALLPVALASLSYVVTFWEQRVSGKMILMEVGNTEGLVALSLLGVGGSIAGPDLVTRARFVAGLTVADVFYALVLCTLAVTVLAPAWRVRRRALDLLPFVAVHGALLAWGWSGEVPFAAACGLFVALTPLVAGRMLIARVVRPSLRPDWLVLAGTAAASAIGLLFRPGAAVEAVLGGGLLAIAGVRAASDLAGALGALSQHLRAGELLSRFVRAGAR